MKFNVILDKKINFLLMCYEYFKKQQTFEQFPFLSKIEFNDKHRLALKRYFRSDTVTANSDIELLEELYTLNSKEWENYIEANTLMWKKSSFFFEEKLSKYDFSKLEAARQFFKGEKVEKIDVYLCAGNSSSVCTGNSFKTNVVAVFMRDFPFVTNETLELDFAVLVHEIVHLYQNCKDINKDLLERFTKGFAPRGILINRNKVKKEDENFVNKLESYIAERKTIYDVVNEVSFL